MGRYFQALASYEKTIGSIDKDFIVSELTRMRTGADVVVNDVTTRLTRVLKWSVGLNAAAFGEAMAKVAAAVAANCNPFKIIF